MAKQKFCFSTPNPLHQAWIGGVGDADWERGGWTEALKNTETGSLDEITGRGEGGSFATGTTGTILADAKASSSPDFFCATIPSAFHLLTDLCGRPISEREKAFRRCLSVLSRPKIEPALASQLETVPEATPSPSAISVFPAADGRAQKLWIFRPHFDGLRSARRILTGTTVRGPSPSQRDFPMTGFVEVRYDDEGEKASSYEPVRIQIRNSASSAS